MGLAKTAVNMLNAVQSDHALPASVQAPLLRPSNGTEAATMIAAPLLVPAISVSVTASAPAMLETEGATLGATISSSPVLAGFTDTQTAMIQTSLQNLSGAGYDTSAFQTLIFSGDMPAGTLGMSLTNPEFPTGAALGEGAFASQGTLDSTLEEELLHNAQGLPNQSFGPGDAAAKEAEVEAARKFPDPHQ